MCMPGGGNTNIMHLLLGSALVAGGIILIGTGLSGGGGGGGGGDGTDVGQGPPAFNAGDVTDMFVTNQLVPAFIPLAPPQWATVTFDNEVEVRGGQPLSPEQTRSQPVSMWWPGCDSGAGDLYTVVMADPEGGVKGMRHWLVTNIPGCDIHAGAADSLYMGPQPPAGLGPRTYVILVYKQPGTLDVYEGETGRGNWNMNSFAATNRLVLVAGTFFTAQADAE